ncbi:glycosyltransferase family 2 protein [Klebsiella oxytoca]|uniref:glycosyltransferase family 2 protein n=1 Tax=Klebsiella oxytoca TaxID=571 RepID=UPI001F192AD8|nr:glycosyltransferase [Klebsiella oxytoca]UIM62999.1 glycosyltransferase [Klebsiella oxytoca]
MKFYIAIPTYNGGEIWKTAAAEIKKCVPPNTYVHVIDSSSSDNTVSIAVSNGFNVKKIPGKEFNHGGTRNLAVKDFKEEYDVVIFLTQDAIPQPGFVEKILLAFEDKDVVCAYGRQLPHTNANPLAIHARAFSYPSKGYIAGKESIDTMGLKVFFMSNSFSAYRLSTFKELKGFPENTILCEDMFYTAKSVLAGYKVAYVADAVVRHSHNYTPIEEFKRYFDIGVFHTDEPWIRKNSGGAAGEGRKYIFSELKFLMQKAPLWIPYAFINNFMKISGYKLGQRYRILPKSFVKLFSMHTRYWKF